MRSHHIRSDHARAFLADNASEQQLTGIGRTNGTRQLGAIERQRISANFLAPESSLELIRESSGFGLELLGTLRHLEP